MSGKRGAPQREVTGGEPQGLSVPEIPKGCMVLCFDCGCMGKSKFAARLHPSSKRKQKLTLTTIPTMLHQIRSDQISRLVMSDSLRPHESQHARPPCPSPTPRVHSDSSIESVMPSNHLILCRPLLLLPPILPSIRVFSNESTLCMRSL